MRVLLLGRPGSGKGTQARRISFAHKVPAISTGDLLRQAVAAQTGLGKACKDYLDQGALVPDALVLGLIQERLGEGDCAGGFLLDGFPRTIGQAEALEAWLVTAGTPLECALHLSVPDKDLIERAMGRRLCPDCGASFHLRFHPPKKDGACDHCGGTLFTRSDDTEAVVRARTAEYGSKTAPLLQFYRTRGLLCEVDGLGELDVVAERVDTGLAKAATARR